LDVEPLHAAGVLPHVDADGDEILANQLVDAGFRIDLGLQPSTATSEGSGGEVEHNRPPFPFRLLQSSVDVLSPIDHGSLLS
jgi:hypothetical protein